MVLDDVIYHWVMVVAATEEGMEMLSMLMQDLTAYFHANNGIIALNQPERLNREFEILSYLFDRVGLRTNTRKPMSIA